MYRYDEFDTAFVADRVAQFRDQVARRLAGELTEDEFKPLRLMNGLYLQLHAYMLRVAIPYGTLSRRRRCASSRTSRGRYDKGYGHFTTRQNIQYNWPELRTCPTILAELAEVEMHAIQTSGNCIRNVTADQFAGVAADEIEDPRVYAEIIRQWSTLHPEFSFLPRKFKIAVTGAATRPRGDPDRTTSASSVERDGDGRARLRGHRRRRPGPHADDRQGRSATSCRSTTCSPTSRRSCASTTATAGATTSTRRASRSWSTSAASRPSPEEVEAEFAEIRGRRARPAAPRSSRASAPISRRRPSTSGPIDAEPGLDAGDARPTAPSPLGASATSPPTSSRATPSSTISLKPTRRRAGRRHGRADGRRRRPRRPLQPSARSASPTSRTWCCRTSTKRDLRTLYGSARRGRAAPPATSAWSPTSSPARGSTTAPWPTPARSRSPSGSRERFADLERQHDIGELTIKISGCINACGHHHVGHIGILGVDKKGEEFYQITLGGARRRGRRDRRDRRPGLLRRRRWSTPSRRSSTPISGVREDPQESFLDDLPPGRRGAVQGGALWRLRHSTNRIAVLRTLPPAMVLDRLLSGEPARDVLRYVLKDIAPGRTAVVVLVRRGIGGAAAPRRAGRPDDAGHLPGDRQAFPRDARLSRHAGRGARPDRRALDEARSRSGSRRTIPTATSTPATPTAAATSARRCRSRPRSQGFDVWLTGRKRHQNALRQAMPRRRGGDGRAQGQPARRMELDRDARLHGAARTAAASARRPGLPLDRLRALHEPGRRRARTSGPAAGAARTRPNAAST